MEGRKGECLQTFTSTTIYAKYGEIMNLYSENSSEYFMEGKKK